MSNLITDWRVAVQAWLVTSFPGADVAGGEQDGVNRGPKPLIVVWHPGWPVLPKDLSLATPTLLIRYFPTRSKQVSTTVPHDPSDLEQAEVDVMVAFKEKRKGGDFVTNLACFISSATPNYAPDKWYVQFTLQAISLHLATEAA